ncbi:ABC transporter permease [Nocardia sp. CDC159]|uniref:ABC transporter permease n=1 Tax=Nocardia pulmonis TaxID=2951408 RepID=A0A9X2IXK1_9NOCA|nr:MULTISPECIES: ABC transporter permease [Nocardia]MCM6773950.1 ABC transporter permease [Nocardia pulmonis]MCM6786837.1 ABC transporter permease [Nocardia sp. CDC159]
MTLEVPRRRAAMQGWVLALRLIRPSVRNGEVLTAVLAPTVFTLGFYVPLNRVMNFVGFGLSSYAQFLMPMIVMQAVSFCATAAAFRAAADARDGLTARFATMPMPSVTPLLARTAATGYRIALSLLVALVCGHVIGFRFYGSWWHTAGFLGFGLLVGVMLGLAGDVLGTLSKSPEATTQALMLPQLILGMVSTGFVPAHQFPRWIQGFARDQPVSQFVEVMRALAGDRSGRTAVVSWATLGPGIAWASAGLVSFGGVAVIVALRRQR